MKTFFCRRLPPEGEYITPQQCDTHRARPRRDERLTRQDIVRLKEMGLDPDVKQPMACLNCKEWARLCASAKEREEEKPAPQAIPQDEPRKPDPKPEVKVGSKRLTQEDLDATARAVQEHGTGKAAADAIGISYTTLYWRLKIHPELKAKKAPGPLPQKDDLGKADIVDAPAPDRVGPKPKPIKINIEIEAVTLQEFTERLRGFVG